jgi:DNA-nicking Smr family endonuclease
MPPRNSPDTALWQRAVRGVKPLAERPQPVPEPKSVRQPTHHIPAGPPQPVPSHPPLDRLSGIDRANAERLKRGKRRIEARLDLHGMTQDEAHRALFGFIRAARAAGRRCVLVITGRGSVGGGVLRAAVPRWFEEAAFRPHLLGIAPAQPRDGGAGALYVMLRRNSTEPER